MLIGVDIWEDAVNADFRLDLRLLGPGLVERDDVDAVSCVP